jgi:ferrous iron transport protein B
VIDMNPDSAATAEASPTTGCACQGTVSEDITGMPVLAIVGGPNVGKSVMFNNLTGRYVTVSNYPGTTVEVSRGRGRIEGKSFGVVDTPGMYSLTPITDEERVARRMLLKREPGAVIHMVDAKNLERMLPLTLQLLELGLPVVLVLNMMDEAERLGLQIDVGGLSREIGIPVVAAVATSRRGLPEIRKEVLDIAQAREVHSATPVRYEATVEEAIDEVARRLPEPFARAARGIALLLLQEEVEVAEAVRAADPAASRDIEEIVRRRVGAGKQPLRYRIAMQRQAVAREVAGRHVVVPRGVARTFADRLSDITTNPLTGVPILAAIIYFGLYKFVGVFGAGDVVNLLENKLFGEHISPWFNSLFERLLPGNVGWHYWARELFGSDYGLVTLGVTYAMAIVLPIVSLFFLFFSVLEDTGYFPRLALLVDRVFKKIGLNGRAVIPLVLGFGCDTMATMVTRIQETKRERVLTTLLLALAIPCSAQYGVITALLAKQPAGVLGISYAWLAWAGILLLIFMVTGRLASRVIPGQPATFYMELPPLRLPRLSNVVVKTLARMKWYFLEVLPLFLLASVLIWIGRITHIFDMLVAALRPVVSLIGLPAQTATAFLYGFFRRDFGAAGLYQMADAGQLTGAQLLIACVTLTLFLPCVAQFLVMKKERGLKMAVVMSTGILCVAFVVGGVVNLVLKATGLTL